MHLRVRSGFTVTELIVCLIVLVCLIGLFVPGIVPPRERARQTTCTNNLRNIGLATESRTVSGRGTFPGYLQLLKFNPPAVAKDRYLATPAADMVVAWSGILLPHLDQAALWYGVFESSVDPYRPPRLEVFLCPQDVLNDEPYPGLSYVANTGAPDVVASKTTTSDDKANGVFHNHLPGARGPRVRRAMDIPDGANRTLMYSENFQRDDPEFSNQFGNTYLGPAPVGTIPAVTNVEQWYGMMWVFDPRSPLSPRAARMERFGEDSRTGPAVNRPYGSYRTRFARPTSNHPDLFLVAFCGGNTRAISTDIDYWVYQQLMTPNGARCKWLATPNVSLPPAFSDADPMRRLTDSDY
jgi:hypothetical protein